MAIAIHVPRINNNDDEVKLVELKVDVGNPVERGQVVASVETDKAVVDVEAPESGFLLAVIGEVDAMVRVGSVLAWLGATADEQPPAAAASPAHAVASGSQPTGKARALLETYGLTAADVAASGDRLNAGDVERHVADRGLAPVREGAVASASTSTAATASKPDVAGTARALRSDQRGMLATVSWHRDVAVPGYIELPYDPNPWDERAAAFQKQHQLLLNPLLPLMAWRLVTLAAEIKAINATIVDNRRWEYDQINLGFTVQAGDVLYLAVTRDAAALGELDFVQHLVDLQRRAAAHNLGPQETQGTTVGFSSMARWKVSRHVPVLAPHTALMVAHAVGPDGQAVLGATYDHRVLHGADVVGVLRKLGKPA
jgi:pyruvate/2-oxoglutarate dehydrogenase complex dihydrolipoamide acyltransferase (E2) component